MTPFEAFTAAFTMVGFIVCMVLAYLAVITDPVYGESPWWVSVLFVVLSIGCMTGFILVVT